MVTQEGLEPSTSCSGGKTGPLEKREVAASLSEGFVYFVQWGDGGPLKIGWAVEPERRLAELQCASPVELLLVATARGGRALERRLHRLLVDHRIRGEWFQPSERLREAIRREIGNARFLEALQFVGRQFATAQDRREARDYFTDLERAAQARADARFRNNLATPPRAAR